MKKYILIPMALLFALNMNAQKKKKGNDNDFETKMIEHYSKFYKTMMENRDFVSAIQGLNHLIILEPQNTVRKDTLGLLYYTVENAPLAIKTLENSQSELGLRTKALAYRKINDVKNTISSYEELLKKYYNVNDAYELAQIQYGVQNFGDAKLTINEGLQRATTEKVKIIIAKNSYIETKIQAAFLNMLGLIEYNNNVANTDIAVAIFDKALEIDPEFVLALENKKGILAKKEGKKE